MNSLDMPDPVHALLDTWADAIRRHEPDRVAALFTPDALFQGFDPVPGHGQQFVAAYYDKQPAGLWAQYEVHSVRALGADTLVGFARVEFHRPEGIVPVHLTVVAEHAPAGWRISHYHVSRILTA